MMDWPDVLMFTVWAGFWFGVLVIMARHLK